MDQKQAKRIILNAVSNTYNGLQNVRTYEDRPLPPDPKDIDASALYVREHYDEGAYGMGNPSVNEVEDLEAALKTLGYPPIKFKA